MFPFHNKKSENIIQYETDKSEAIHSKIKVKLQHYIKTSLKKGHIQTSKLAKLQGYFCGFQSLTRFLKLNLFIFVWYNLPHFRANISNAFYHMIHGSHKRYPKETSQLIFRVNQWISFCMTVTLNVYGFTCLFLHFRD